MMRTCLRSIVGQPVPLCVHTPSRNSLAARTTPPVPFSPSWPPRPRAATQPTCWMEKATATPTMTSKEASQSPRGGCRSRPCGRSAPRVPGVVHEYHQRNCYAACHIQRLQPPRTPRAVAPLTVRAAGGPLSLLGDSNSPPPPLLLPASTAAEARSSRCRRRDRRSHCPGQTRQYPFRYRAGPLAARSSVRLHPAQRIPEATRR